MMRYRKDLVSMALSTPAQKDPSSGAGRNAPMVAGMVAIDWAKMMGRTPDMFTFMGRLLVWPPYILRPT